MSGMGVWTSTKTDEKKLAIFKRTVLRQIFGPKKNEETNEFERRTYDNLYDLYNQPDVVAVMKSKRIGWQDMSGVLKEKYKIK